MPSRPSRDAVDRLVRKEVVGAMRSMRGILRASATTPGAGYVISALSVGVATPVLLAFRGPLGKDVAALLYVPIIIATAGLTGRRGWWFTPVIAFLTLDFFFTVPYYTFYMYDPHDWLLLGIFLVVGLVASLEVGRLHERTREASGRLRDLLVLNRLSLDLVSLSSREALARVIGTAVEDSVDRVLLMVSNPEVRGDLHPVAGVPSESESEVADWVLANGKAVGLPASTSAARASEPWPVSVEWPDGLQGPPCGIYLPLQSSIGRAQGVLLFETPVGRPPAVDQLRLFISVANLTATFLERHQLQDKAVALASLEEADKLKSGFIAAVSHDIKTPLAAAKARVSGLLEGDVPCDDRLQREELAAVEANLDRLDVTIGDLLDLSRLENDAWRPRFERHELGEILSTMLSHLPDPSEERVRVTLPSATVVVKADFRQMERALRNVVENALKYSDQDVLVSVETDDRNVTIGIEDHGPGIPPHERERVFEPFFRGSSMRGEASGTGLGLAITREIVAAHGGNVRIEDVHPHGTRLVISLTNEEEM
jgi:two-component system sensor histidine kinase KdpD